MLAKATLLATTMGMTNRIDTEFAERKIATNFFRCRNIEPPAFKVADRLSEWDADNWSILGGVGGLLVAHRRVCPLPNVSRPLWYMLHVISGLYLGALGHTQHQATVLSKERVKRQAGTAAMQRLSYFPDVVREISVEPV